MADLIDATLVAVDENGETNGDIKFPRVEF